MPSIEAFMNPSKTGFAAGLQGFTQTLAPFLQMLMQQNFRSEELDAERAFRREERDEERAFSREQRESDRAFRREEREAAQDFTLERDQNAEDRRVVAEQRAIGRRGEAIRILGESDLYDMESWGKAYALAPEAALSHSKFLAEQKEREADTKLGSQWQNLSRQVQVSGLLPPEVMQSHQALFDGATTPHEKSQVLLGLRSSLAEAQKNFDLQVEAQVLSDSRQAALANAGMWLDPLAATLGDEFAAALEDSRGEDGSGLGSTGQRVQATMALNLAMKGMNGRERQEFLDALNSGNQPAVNYMTRHSATRRKLEEERRRHQKALARSEALRLGGPVAAHYLDVYGHDEEVRGAMSRGAAELWEASAAEAAPDYGPPIEAAGKPAPAPAGEGAAALRENAEALRAALAQAWAGMTEEERAKAYAEFNKRAAHIPGTGYR